MNIRLITQASLAGLLLMSQPLPANELQQRQAALKAISSQINQQASSVKATNKQRQQLQDLLKKDETSIAKIAKKRNQTQTALKETKTKLSELNARQQQLKRTKVAQQQILAKQLTSAYLTGHHDHTKMLLSQGSTAHIERLLTYYQYLNQARTDSIQALQATLAELTQIQTQQAQRQTQLNKLILEQTALANKLKQEQKQRQNTLVQLQKTLNSESLKLEQLQIEQASLRRLIEQSLTRMQESSALSGLPSKAKLNWPTKGAIKTAFGHSRSGKVKWKGVTIASKEGQGIQAIAAGKVIYADWVRGFGMVLILDHGKGDMSLYGHAQALLKAPGDRVKQNETIALVGQSGGLSQPSLYFEIRHKGQAVDPANYCKG